jgi:hypothetical protein
MAGAHDPDIPPSGLEPAREQPDIALEVVAHDNRRINVTRQSNDLAVETIGTASLPPHTANRMRGMTTSYAMSIVWPPHT